METAKAKDGPLKDRGAGETTTVRRVLSSVKTFLQRSSGSRERFRLISGTIFEEIYRARSGGARSTKPTKSASANSGAPWCGDRYGKLSLRAYG